MKEVVKQREEPQQSNLLKWEEKWEEKLASVVPLIWSFLFFTILWRTVSHSLEQTPLLKMIVTDLEVVPIRVCNVTGHFVRVTHDIASGLVYRSPTLWARGYKWVGRVHTLPITLDLQEPQAGWKHLGSTAHTHRKTNKHVHQRLLQTSQPSKHSPNSPFYLVMYSFCLFFMFLVWCFYYSAL